MPLEQLILEHTAILFDVPAALTAEQRPGRAWTIRQELGHLVDSAINNYNRIVRAALDGSFTGPSYEPDGWVNLGGYNDMPWVPLVSLWRDLNLHLARALAHVPQDKMTAPCTVGTEEPVTLQFLMEDYAKHIEHHIDQMLACDNSEASSPQSRT